MTDNEKLIEDAATAMWADPEQWATITEPVREDFRCMARAALAVFQKAHTPTDDEREAWRDEAIRRYPHAEVAKYMRQALHNAFIEGAKFAAGFRRSEPKDCYACNGVGLDLGPEGFIADRKCPVCLTDHETQGEPSDAQVDRLVEASMVALIHDSEVPTGMRPHLLGGEVLVIRERTDAEPIVQAVIHAVIPALRAAGGEGR